MRPDLYTKIVLTIIALSLVFIALRPFLGPTALRAQDILDVRVVEVDQPIDIDVAQVAGLDMVRSANGMYVGVLSTDNTIIPIHWGEVSIATR